MRPVLRAEADQLIEDARAAIPDIGLIRTDLPAAVLLGNIIKFVCAAEGDDLGMRAVVRLLAVADLAAITIQGEDPCPDSLLPGWSQ